MNQRTFVIGDIHGAHLALLQVLKRSSFNKSTDKLICLGDVCDGWPQTRECVEDLMGISHLTYILGNHDYYALKWMKGEDPGETWSFQGGDTTVTSYSGVPLSDHITFFESASLYVELDNRLFVHAGLDPTVPIEDQNQKTLLWDRELARKAYQLKEDGDETKLTTYDEVYIGHTPIHHFGYLKPIKACEIWFMDTGAGWNGCLSMMNIQTKEVFTSDTVTTLYPDHTGRF